MGSLIIVSFKCLGLELSNEWKIGASTAGGTRRFVTSAIPSHDGTGVGIPRLMSPSGQHVQVLHVTHWWSSAWWLTGVVRYLSVPVR
jgi:hypothetical protein